MEKEYWILNFFNNKLEKRKLKRNEELKELERKKYYVIKGTMQIASEIKKILIEERIKHIQRCLKQFAEKDGFKAEYENLKIKLLIFKLTKESRF